MLNKYRFTWILLFALLSVSVLNAQMQHINNARGFNANGVYSFHDIDSVNLFNGNLTLVVPISGSLHVNGAFSYQISLFYNSELWHHQEICPINQDPNAGRENYALYWNYFRDPSGYTTWAYERGGPMTLYDDGSEEAPNQSGSGCYTVSRPNAINNAGHGWQLSLGKIYVPKGGEIQTYNPFISETNAWVYQSPDGSEHTFYPKLHESDPFELGDDLGPTQDPVMYTRDGSYLRMKMLPNSSDRIVEFPNGDVHTFRNFGSKIWSDGNTFIDWRLIEMRDASGDSKVTISYTTDQWTITEYANVGGVLQQLRQHFVNFNVLLIPNDPQTQAKDPKYYQVLQSVNLAGFNGIPRNYTFSYELQKIMRGSPVVSPPGYSPKIYVPFLTSVNLPDSSQYSMPLANSYDTSDDGIYASPKLTGVIRGITIPTGAKIEWEYLPEPGTDIVTYGYKFPDGSSGRFYGGSTTGIRKRTVTVNGSSYVWTYEPRLEKKSETRTPQGGVCGDDFTERDPLCTPKEFVNKVTNPQGDYTLYYFSVYPLASDPNNLFNLLAGRSVDAWHAADYGLPLTKWSQISDSKGNPVFLSSQVYKKLGEGSYSLVRSKYVRYETDKVPEANGSPGYIETNRRVIAERTVFNDDSNKYSEVQYSNFDGLGNYRNVELTGNLYSGSRVEETLYNADFYAGGYNSGEYRVDPTTNSLVTSYNQFSKDMPWVLGRYVAKHYREGTSSSKEEYYFDQYGRLIRQRKFKDTGTFSSTPARSANDIVVQYTYQGGNVAAEEYFGGDKQTLSLGALHTMALPASEYRINRTYQFGKLATSQYAGTTFYSVNNEIDRSSGLIERSIDPSGITTDFIYDSMNRLKEARPLSESYTIITYTPATSTSKAKAQVSHQPNGGGAELAYEEYIYDGLGRLNIERMRLSDSTLASREILYNGMGWQTSVSEWGATGKRTEYRDYDAFGRATWVVGPDGSDTRFRYWGARQVRRTVKIGTSRTSSGVIQKEDVTNDEVYDHLGRLREVSENSGINGQQVTTRYSYDIGNRLSQVQTSATAPNSNWQNVNITQTRVFTYDNRGFLITENHPELSATGIQSGGYDSIGNIGSLNDGLHQLNYSYDKAGRLLNIKELRGTQWKLLKEFAYDTGTYAGGKLVMARRYNYVQNPYNPGDATVLSVQVAENYTYNSKGLLATKLTVLDETSPSPFRFDQSFNYDALGNLTSQSYPKCTNATCVNSAAQTARTINYIYTKNWLTGVTGYATINYHPNGMLNTVSHANGVSSIYDIDLDYMQRVRQVRTTSVVPSGGVNMNWISGAYIYDDTGNAVQIGSNWYLYDKVGRITEGTALGGQQKKQNYTYDAFGNLRQTKTSVSEVNDLSGVSYYIPGIDPNTNRMSGVSYDAAGNNLGGSAASPAQLYTYDAVNMIKNAPGFTYLYNANDERVWTVDRGFNDKLPQNQWPTTFPTIIETITLRGLRDELLREYRIAGRDGNGRWSWRKDYIYRGNKLLSSEGTEGTRHYTLDHLGTPRVVTNSSAQRTEYHQYFPFGTEATADFGSASRMRFTGHERDNDYSSQSMDYMHARFYSTQGGKFMSIDPGRDFNPATPQSWNLYSYVRNDAMNAVDPTGEATVVTRNGVTYTTYTQEEIDQMREDYEKVHEIINRLMMLMPFVAEFGGMMDTSIGGVRTDGGAGMARGLTPYKLGGSYGEVSEMNKVRKDSTYVSYEAHEMPSRSVMRDQLPLPRNQNPSVAVPHDVHKRTGSYGNSGSAQQYRAVEADLLSQGKIRDAIALNIKDLRRAASTASNTVKIEIKLGIGQYLRYWKSIWK